MKTIQDYTIYCTPEQTKKALELGAPIQYASIADKKRRCFCNINKECYALPTAEQLIGWLEEKGLRITIHINCFNEWFVLICNVELLTESGFKKSRKEATLAAIDAALEYLTNNKK